MNNRGKDRLSASGWSTGSADDFLGLSAEESEFVESGSYWRLSAPAYESGDYESCAVNGNLVHPFSLPGINCDVCGETWSSIRILPFLCPEGLRNRSELLDGWPISGSRHHALRAEVTEALRAKGYEPPVLMPGDTLQPGYLDVPSILRADFLWSSLGSVVISKRVRDLLIELASDHIACIPVIRRRIGNVDLTAEIPIATTGEPEDLIEEIEMLEDISGVGEYFEMLVQSQSALPPDSRELAFCRGCGRRSYDNSERTIRAFPGMSCGAPIFQFATTLQVIVTDELRRALEQAGATNVVFEAMRQ